MLSDKIKALSLAMKSLKLSEYIFIFDYNNIEFTVLIETHKNRELTLTFIKSKNEFLTVPIRKSYDVNFQPAMENGEFWSFFEIKRLAGGFSLKKFRTMLANNIPQNISNHSTQLRLAISAHIDIEDSKKIYYNGLYNWAQIRAKNPSEKRSQSNKNKFKTQLLLPELYEIIKDYDISVRFTHIEPKNERNQINVDLQKSTNLNQSI